MKIILRFTWTLLWLVKTNFISISFYLSDMGSRPCQTKN